MGSDWGAQTDLLMASDCWRTMIAPGEKKEYDLIHEAGVDVWVHSCGNIQRILPDLKEMGVDALNPVQPECMDIYDIKEKYGNTITFWGGISTQQTLPCGTPEEVVAETRRVTEALSKNGGYIIAPPRRFSRMYPLKISAH